MVDLGIFALYLLGAISLGLGLSLALQFWRRPRMPISGISSIIMSLLIVVGAVSLSVGRWQHAHRNEPAKSISQERPGYSISGKNDSARDKTEAARAGEILRTARDIQVSDDQRRAINNLVRRDQPNTPVHEFSLSIGAAVPRQVELNELPPEVTDVLHGYQGDKYFIMKDQFVIVETASRRVVAIVPLG